MSTTSLPHLVTIGVIASELDVPLHRVRHILQTRDHINPRALAGRARLFHPDAIAEVRHELNSQDARGLGRGEAV